MNARRRFEPNLRTSEDGISLTELIVAMMIFGIASMIVVGFFVSTTKTMALAQTLSVNTKQASNAMNESARFIRAGTENPLPNSDTNDPAFVEARDETLTMYAYVNLQSSEQTPIMVQLYLDGRRQLVEKQWAAIPVAGGYWSFPSTSTTPASTRVLATFVAPRTSPERWLFTYVTEDGTVLPANTSMTPDQRRSIAAVTVSLSLQKEGAPDAHRVTLRNTVGIPNLGKHRVVT